ncbi:hypothetical protein SB48_HM08orf06609 [Heyndrickxia coagulans]|uniref:Uncharacterized protein n=1 Tax=Heyndrickxia coagulans TaxID=1398 RepID=A0AAN0T8Q0_HEYCO|nr:hypothetical protein SB48_HM08orf06609 [Heyndrickxia coagulans]
MIRFPFLYYSHCFVKFKQEGAAESINVPAAKQKNALDSFQSGLLD